MPMKHAASRALHAYWDRLRKGRSAPERGDLDPGAIRGLLGDVFLLELGGLRPFLIRLAGTRLCGLFCRELRGSSLEALFAPDERPEFTALIDEVVGTMTPVVAGLQGETAERQRLDLELLALPLRHRGRTHARLFGALAALDVPYWVGTVPLKELRIVSVRRLQAGPAPYQQEVERPRPVGRLRVLPGGRA
jgi:hypothetical protein